MTPLMFDEAPDFGGETCAGTLPSVLAWKGRRWAVVVSAAANDASILDLRRLAERLPDFAARGATVLAVTETHAPSATPPSNEPPTGVTLLRNADGSFAQRYGLPPLEQATSRSLTILTPADRIAATMDYPWTVSLSVDEIIRVVDALSLSRHKLAAPAGWRPGDDVVVGRVIPDRTAQARFGHIDTVTHYLRTTRQPAFTQPGR